MEVLLRHIRLEIDGEPQILKSDLWDLNDTSEGYFRELASEGLKNYFKERFAKLSRLA
jgi:hypothetical protein